MSDQDQKNKILSWWLARGFALLPSQPGTKFLVKGYGQYQKHVTKTRDAFKVFSSPYNVSVLGHGGTIILDFDDIEVYKTWVEKNPEEAQTYTEITPRGGRHVFLFGRVPDQIELIPGVELKRVCMVSPSVVNGKGYIRGAGEILEACGTSIFSSLSKIGTKTAYVRQIEQNQRARRAHVANSVIDQIKLKIPIEQIFNTYRPGADFSRGGRYVDVLCPFHNDHKPSMFLDRELNIFRCRACNAHGDAINLYARFAGISNSEAIARLARLAGVRS